MRTIRATLGCAIVLLLVVGRAGAAGDLAPMQVFTDALNDAGATAPDISPSPEDLVAGSIAETAHELKFIWEVVDLPDGSGGVPFAFQYNWEFELDDPGPNPPQAFGVRAQPYTPHRLGATVHNDLPAPVDGDVTVGRGGAVLEGNCTTTGNFISCEEIPGSLVTVEVDDVANTITAIVRRSDLRGADGEIVATDGAVLVEANLFDGIGAYMSVGVLCSCNGDTADMNVDEEGRYVLGSPR